jgi:hypothetical protein
MHTRAKTLRGFLRNHNENPLICSLLSHIIHDVQSNRTDAVSLILGLLLRTYKIQSVFRLNASNTL